MLKRIFASKERAGRDQPYTEYVRWYPLLFFHFFLCAVLFLAVRYVTNQQIQNHAEQTTAQFYVQSSAMLREMRLFGEALTNNAEFNKMIHAGSALELDSLEFCSFISETMENSPYIKHVYVVNDALDCIYSDEGYFSRNSLNAILSKLGLDARSVDFGDYDQQIKNASHLLPYLSIPIYSADGVQQIGTTIITLSMTEFLRSFYMLDASLCCVFNDSFFISSFTTFSETSIDWRDPAAIAKLVGEPVTCVYQDTPDYTYLVAVSNSDYNKPLTVIVLCFLLYAVAIIGIHLVSMRKAANQRKAVVNTLIHALPDYTGAETYSSVIPEIRERLQEHQRRQDVEAKHSQERNLRYILYGHNRHVMPDEFFASAGISTPFAQDFYVVSFHLHHLSSSTVFDMETRDKGSQLATMVLQSALEGLLKQKSCSFASCFDIDTLIVVFWSEDKAGFKRDILDVSQNVIDLLLSGYNVSIQAIVSAPIHDVRKLPDAFNQTRDLNEFSNSTDNHNPLIVYEDLIDQESSCNASNFVRQEQILINTLLSNKYHMIPDMVRSILEETVSPLQKDFDLARSRLRSIANLLAEAVLSAGKNGASNEQVILQFRRVNSVSELNAVTQEHFSRLSVLSEEFKNENEIVQRACKTIADSIRDHNLNVSAICEAVGVSAQRLTRMFHVHFDMTIAEYMNKQRIELSKTLLREYPKMSIAEIAETVGYNNTHSLARNFRKLEGLTPSEYRELRL